MSRDTRHTFTLSLDFPDGRRMQIKMALDRWKCECLNRLPAEHDLLECVENARKDFQVIADRFSLKNLRKAQSDAEKQMNERRDLTQYVVSWLVKEMVAELAKNDPVKGYTRKAGE